MENEFWKDVVGFEGFYKISSLGRIKSLSRYVVNARNSSMTKLHIGKILKPCISGEYLVVALCSFGIPKNFLLHRLVAIHFVPNPDNKQEVNHKKGIKLDCRANELEWTTPKENSQHSKYILGNNPSGYNNPRSKEVFQISLDGFLLEIFGSINEASRKCKINSRHISRASSLGKKAGGFIWLR